ncbi:MAG TPA: hypothetical protein VGN63_09225 [Flavisolibacter sp.]|jgi:hypothetical protein|nr:hypothetical protein [Flavisolibacter sp.]
MKLEPQKGEGKPTLHQLQIRKFQLMEMTSNLYSVLVRFMESLVNTRLQGFLFQR